MVGVNIIQRTYPLNEVLIRIARTKYGNYGLNPTDIHIDHQGRAVLSDTADRESWNYCLAEAQSGVFSNDDLQS